MMNQTTIEMALEQLKRVTAAEMGIELGSDTTARMNGAVGGKITQKLIELGKQQLVEMSQEQVVNPVLINQTVNNQSQLH
ncbi:hypothetical protein AF332_11735 [Sporosarcina globispora]|uniref:Spore protein n=1 Tax=Sporosarcina globispora TaxID=1459 RepID=A0A0M0GDC8_SPOGL|nr:hypothetical protein AF332_11735 [Sporosarcina globispora]